MDSWGTHWLLAPVIVLAAMGVSATLIVLLHPVLRRYAMARVNARSLHREPTPQGGGLAVVLATVGVTCLSMAMLPRLGLDMLAPLAPVFAATALIAVIGVIDDIRGLPVAPRLLLQAAAVALVIAALPADLRIVSALPFWIERVLLVIGGLWFVNLVNFMDGMDWITAAEVVPVTAGILLIAMLDGLPTYAIVVALALLGAMLGFAPFNRPVAKLFLGDVGSLPIGLLVGWLLVLLAGRGHLAAAVLLPLYYLADATITLLRRLAAGETVWHAHRTHYYQRATERGFLVIEIVGRIFAVNLGLVVLAVLTVVASDTRVDMAALAAGCALVAWLLVTLAGGRRSSAGT